jgi:hypothetical protein
MNTTKTAFAGVILAAFLAPGAANAAFVLDTGVPTGAGLPSTLDGNDYYAAEFTLGSGQTITGIQAYMTAGLDQPGATFTVDLYSASDFGTRTASPVYSSQATFTADGWNGLSNLNVSGLAAGNYWAALEVGASDSATGLELPVPGANGTVPALGYAFNAGSGYTSVGAQPFGAEVTVAPVPLPAAVWLLGSGLLGLGAARRGRRADAATGCVLNAH